MSPRCWDCRTARRCSYAAGRRSSVLRKTCCAHEDQPPKDGETKDGDSTAVLSVWRYLGSGCLNPDDVLLEAAVEASLRAARGALLDVYREPP
jgi:hypothetical protein